MNITTATRNATLQDLVELLREQADVRWDAVVPAGRLRYTDEGQLAVSEAAAVVTDEGVTTEDARFRPTDVFENQVADKLGIPVKYLRRMRDEGEAGLLAENVNTWLRHAQDDGKKYLVRGFLAESSPPGLARALLSDHYRPYDHLDVIFAALDGVREAGVSVDIQGGDLSERRMRLRVTCPEVGVHAPAVLLDRYRDPRNPNRTARDYPMVWSGFEIANSETGAGAFTLTPRITFEVCTNGMTRTEDALRRVHLGGQLEEGIVRWSHDTQQRAIELVTAQTRDAVQTFLDADYVSGLLDRIAGLAGEPVTAPTEAIEMVSKKLGYTESEQESILAAFIAGGDATAGGIMQAVTYVASTTDDPDRAGDLEDSAFAALEAVAS